VTAGCKYFTRRPHVGRSPFSVMRQILAKQYHRPQFYFISSLYRQAKRMNCEECIAGMRRNRKQPKKNITVFSNPGVGSNHVHQKRQYILWQGVPSQKKIETNRNFKMMTKKGNKLDKRKISRKADVTEYIMTRSQNWQWKRRKAGTASSSTTVKAKCERKYII
jgi:hypothetical protein